ncbi:MAG: InlB B-repeat-containing protein, partial [Muribaculaceae bacterium]|nr:InlB B-repeat-containing protein [Muribaculaceae bacterium]
PEAPEKEGYTFGGWNDVPETMPAHDIEINGNYTVNNYQAIFVIDGEMIATLTIEYGAVINAPAAPEKEDYTFDGWKDLPETMPAEDIVVTGSYTYSPDIFHAVFMIDGETIATIIVEAGDSIELPEAPVKEGYTFEGWQDVPETMPNHDVVINGTYAVNSYKVTFVIDGEVIDTLTVEYGAVINAPAAPEREDYTFTGWENLPETMPAHDIEVTGTYVDSDGKYNAVFMIDGETVATILVEGGTAIELPEAPAKEGYTFAGWQDVPETMPNHDVVINGSYTVNSYEVLFVVNGETIETRSVEYGSVIEAPEMPEREGYTFSGWLNLPETMPAQSMEIVGNYHPNLYTATFIIDGEVLENVSVEYGSLIPVPVVPEKDDYTFSGWSNLPETMPAHDIEVTGNYIYSPDIFKAVFVIDGEIFETLTLEPGDAITAPAAPEKEGYTFAGWQDVPETMPNHDVVIMGSYTVNSYKAVFMIDGKVVETLSVEYGAVINAPAAPEKEDYTFNGWSNLPETMPAHDIEITGSYTYSPDIFQAVFMIDGETYATIHVECGDPVELPAEPFREGYTFSGWQDIPEEMPHHDVVITGTFTVNTYTVIFMIGDEVIDTRRVDYGASIEVPEVSEKEGYTFEGWTDVPASMPATDLVISGSYKANLYRLLIYLDGSIYLDEELAYGMEIVVPEPEVPDGMQFDGWDIEIPETMPAHDIIVYGTLSVLSWVDIIAAEDNDSLTIYDLNGTLLFKDAKVDEVKDQLTPGVYIINGHKVMVK